MKVRIALLAASAVLSSLLLAGCGSGSSGGETTASQIETTQADETESSAQESRNFRERNPGGRCSLRRIRQYPHRRPEGPYLYGAGAADGPCFPERNRKYL